MIRLPAPIARYFAAADADDADTLAAGFAEDAHVHDERRDHRGRDAVRAWAAEARALYSFRAEPRSFEPAPDGGVVTAHVTGTFPGGRADLRYAFRLAGDLIQTLEITPRPAGAAFTGRRVLVTGGTQGVGAAVADRLAGAGATVFRAARSRPADLERPDLFHAVDLAAPEGAAELARVVLDRLGGVDVIIHNLGGSTTPGGGFAALTEDHWVNELNLNLLSAVRLDRALAPAMLDQGYGVIVHVTSIQRRLPLYESTLAYASAKAALGAYSKALSNELGPKGVRVLSVAPGFTETEAATRMIERLAASEGGDVETARQGLMRALGGIPIGRPNTPDEVTDLIAFLASDRAATIHGTEVVIDGGAVPTV